MNFCDILPLICLLLMACSSPIRGLRPGDLVFQAAGGSRFETAISEATRSDINDFSHVGILDIVAGDTVVIEATPQKGVAVTPLCEFVSGCKSVVYVMVDDPSAACAPDVARQYIGQPYDWTFLPDNGAVYCSELVQLSYLHPDGSLLFAPVPINFLDASGRIPRFWLDIYASRGVQVAQGAPGSSPNSIFSQCGIYKKIEKKQSR